jgi:A/G-specific adenine glycosylase
MVRKDGAVLLRRRPARGLLGGMMEVPSTPWRAKAWTVDEAVPEAPARMPDRLAWKLLPGGVSHTFTHFQLELQVVASDLPARHGVSEDGEVAWVPVDKIGDAGLPSVMAKIARHALRHAV